MTLTRVLSVHAPLEPPELPSHFNFWKYEVTDWQDDADHYTGLEAAADQWFENGHVATDLVIYAESDAFPTGGTETIYAVWDCDNHTPDYRLEPRWDGWYYEDGNKFDPAKFEQEFTAAEGAP